MDLRHRWFDIQIKLLIGAGVLSTSFWITLGIMDMYSPLLGQQVNYSITVYGKPQVCASAVSQIIFEGKICSASGSTVSVRWDSLANVTNTEPACGDAKYIKWARRQNDPEWNNRFLGACGQRPEYLERVPNSFEYNSLNSKPFLEMAAH